MKDKLKKQKKHWIWKTSSMVIIYALILFLCQALQAGISLVQSLEISINGRLLSEIINPNLALPLGPLSMIWIGISAGYIGIDRAYFSIDNYTSQDLSSINLGDPKMLRFIILMTGILLVSGICFNSVVDYDYELTSLATAFASSISLYVIGQKANKICYDLNDTDGNGIPDEDEDEYYRWVGEMRTNKTIDESSINYNTFVKLREEKLRAQANITIKNLTDNE